MSNLITLTCPSCGGRLEVTNNTERYVCAHCGNSHIVDPGVRAEALEKEVAVLKYDEAIRRLEAEIEVLQSQAGPLRSSLSEIQGRIEGQQTDRKIGTRVMWGGLIGFVIGVVFAQGLLLMAGALIALGGFIARTGGDYDDRYLESMTMMQLNELSRQMDGKRELIKQYRLEQMNRRRALEARSERIAVADAAERDHLRL